MIGKMKTVLVSKNPFTHTSGLSGFPAHRSLACHPDIRASPLAGTMAADVVFLHRCRLSLTSRQYFPRTREKLTQTFESLLRIPPRVNRALVGESASRSQDVSGFGEKSFTIPEPSKTKYYNEEIMIGKPNLKQI